MEQARAQSHGRQFIGQAVLHQQSPAQHPSRIFILSLLMAQNGMARQSVKTLPTKD
jgi:hypothetical protein